MSSNEGVRGRVISTTPESGGTFTLVTETEDGKRYEYTGCRVTGYKPPEFVEVVEGPQAGAVIPTAYTFNFEIE